MVWNKGFTKFTHPGVNKISNTMKMNKIDNFKAWRDTRKQERVRSGFYTKPRKSRKLAELIGFTLGDGNISNFPRTQRLILTCNANNPGLITRYKELVVSFLGKQPRIYTVKGTNAVRIDIYRKDISKRLGVPSGNRKELENLIPKWVAKRRSYIIGMLRGLFEAEGSLTISKRSYTYNFQFSNRNRCLLDYVYDKLTCLEYHPERRTYSIRIRRKEEVERFRKLIEYRVY